MLFIIAKKTGFVNSFLTLLTKNLKFLYKCDTIIASDKDDERKNDMYLDTPEIIPEIDKYAEEVLSLPTRVLMQRAGSAVARAVREITPMGASVLILAGKQ